MIAIKIVLVFVLFGPPIGSVIYLVGVAAVIKPWSGYEVLAIPFLMIIAIPFSYIFGILPALAAGILTAVGESISRRFGFVHVALLGLVCGLVFALTFDQKSNGNLGYAVIKVLTCALPTIGCWMLSRRWNFDE